MNYIHIDTDVHIRTGEDARAALEQVNDRAFLSSAAGIVRVPIERWRTAQTAEASHWMTLGLNEANDRNEEHYELFDRYRVLNGRSFRHAVELGCGPFTNLRFVARACDIEKCSLLDPLITQYLTHPHCRYSREALRVEEWDARSLPGRAVRKLLRPILRRVNRLPIEELFPTAIEQMPPGRTYDLVAMINVIEHCFDVDQVFDKVLSITPSGSYFLFHDKYYDHAQVAEIVQVYYDAAHPLQVDRQHVSSFLETNFETVFQSVQSHHVNWAGGEDTYESVYFIGRRR